LAITIDQVGRDLIPSPQGHHRRLENRQQQGSFTMAKTHDINVEFRDLQGKGASRRLRHTDNVPAIIYGGGEAPRMLQLDQKIAYRYSQQEWFFTNILILKAGDQTQRALVRDIQRHPYKQRIMHIDFQRVSDNEIVKLRVPVHFLNQEKSPAGKTGGSTILHELNDVEIACYPKDLPEFLEVDLIDLKIGDVLHISDIKLPTGVTIPSLKLGKSHDSSIVIAKAPIVEEVVVAAPAASKPVPAAKQKAPETSAAAKAPAKKK
jgi:large subunit ribosomal protein L25